MDSSWLRDINCVPVVAPYDRGFVTPRDGEPRFHLERCPHFEIILVTWGSKRPFSSTPGVNFQIFMKMSVQAVFTGWRTSCDLPVWLTRDLLVLGPLTIFFRHTPLLQISVSLAHILMHHFWKISDIVLVVHCALEGLWSLGISTPVCLTNV